MSRIGAAVITDFSQEELAVAASALLSSRIVVHHEPQGRDDSPFFDCDWCGRRVYMTEMRSEGGASMWCARKGEVWSRTAIGCWEVRWPCA